MEDDGPANGTIYGGQGVIGAAPSAIDCAVSYEWSVRGEPRSEGAAREWWIANCVVARWKAMRQRPEHALLVRLSPASIAPSETYRRSPLILVDLAPKA